MPRGSKIGERRGGRQRGTPNRRTVLLDRMMDIASQGSTMSAWQFIDFLVKDRELPVDIRMAIARGLLPSGRSRPVGVKVARSSVEKRRKKSAGARPEPGTVMSAALDLLLSIAQDGTMHLDQRRKVASEAARHLLPTRPATIRRWWVNAPVDEYGFAIRPQIAAEYRDLKYELEKMAVSRANGPATELKMARMRARLKAIQHRLQCPCPSRYGWDQLKRDGERLKYFSDHRKHNITLSEEENAEEAHRRARFDSFMVGAEVATRQRLIELQEKARRFRNKAGPRLILKERVDLRVLQLLYPPDRPPRSDADAELDASHPLRHAPLAADGNLHPPNSTLRPLKDGDIVDEFVEVLPYVYGNPNYPDHKWSWEPAQPTTRNPTTAK